MRWPSTTLGDVCEFVYGKALKADIRQEGTVKVMGSNGVVGIHDVALTSGPTVVIGRKGSIGAVSYADESCWPIDTAYYVDSAHTSADLRWLFWTLQSLGLPSMNKSAAVPGLNREDAYRLSLPLPPLPEQRRIAAILDHADALRGGRRRALILLDRAVDAAFLRRFGTPREMRWPVGVIGDLLESATYGTSSKATLAGEVPVLRMGNLTVEGAIDYGDLKYISAAEASLPQYQLRRGDILFNRTNSADLVGKTAVFRDDREMSYAGYLVRLRVNERAAPDYVAGFLNSSYGKAKLRSMAKSIVGMANINAKEVQQMTIPVPPIEEQLAFAALKDKIESNKRINKVALDRANELFASLQQRAFEGAL